MDDILRIQRSSFIITSTIRRWNRPLSNSKITAFELRRSSSLLYTSLIVGLEATYLHHLDSSHQRHNHRVRTRERRKIQSVWDEKMKEDSKEISIKEDSEGSVKPAKPWHHFGEYPGAPYGTTWKSRTECFDAGVHRQSEAGIHGTRADGAFSIVVSGQYEDDKDNGDTILYTGSGGHKQHSGMREQDRDQVWSNLGNEALRTSVITRKPVRVIRGYELDSEFAPWEGFRYDGLYICKAAWREMNKDGYYKICRFTMERIPGQPPLRRRSTVFGRYRLLPGSVATIVAQPPLPAPENARQRLRQERQASIENFKSFLETH